jgi:Transposase, Mutator family
MPVGYPEVGADLCPDPIGGRGDRDSCVLRLLSLIFVRIGGWVMLLTRLSRPSRRDVCEDPRGRPDGERARAARGRDQHRRAPRDPRPRCRICRGRRRLAGVLARADHPRPDRLPAGTSDAHRGLVDAIGAALPGTSWQRCRTHHLRDLLTPVPKSQARPSSNASVNLESRSRITNRAGGSRS